MRRLFPVKVYATLRIVPAALDQDSVFAIHSRVPDPIRQQSGVHRRGSIF